MVMSLKKSVQKKVVVIEDDADTLEMIELSLKMNGFAVGTAMDTDEALDLIESTQPDVVLMDYYGVSAERKDIVEEIKTCCPHARIVLMTGARSPAEKAKSVGVDDWVAKPFSDNALVEKMAPSPKRTGSAKAKKSAKTAMRCPIFA